MASACVLSLKWDDARYEIGKYSEKEVRNVNAHSLVLTQLRPEARHMSGHLELGLDAVGDRNILSAVSRSACSVTLCMFHTLLYHFPNR